MYPVRKKLLMSAASALTVLLAPLATHAQTAAEDPLAVARVARDEACARAHQRFAADCREQGLAGTARRHNRETLYYDPEDAGTRRALEELPTEEDMEGPRDPAGFENKGETLRRNLARAWTTYAQVAARVGRPHAARSAWRRVLGWDPENARARRELRDDTPPDFSALAAGIRIDVELTSAERDGENAQRALRIFHEELAGALGRIYAATGLRYEASFPFRIAMVPTGAGNGDNVAVTSVGENDCEIQVFVQNWTSRKSEAKFRQTVCHELTHALERLGTGSETYDAIPHWLREGLAVWVAGEGPFKVHWMLGEHGGDVGSLLDGLEPGKTPQTMEDYAEAYMALRFLCEQVGEDWFQRCLDDIHNDGLLTERAIEKTSGMLFRDFEAAAHAYARQNAQRIAAEYRQ